MKLALVLAVNTCVYSTKSNGYNTCDGFESIMDHLQPLSAKNLRDVLFDALKLLGTSRLISPEYRHKMFVDNPDIRFQMGHS